MEKIKGLHSEYCSSLLTNTFFAFLPFFSQDNYVTFLKTSLLTGFTSLALSLATFLQISVTSPTTHMIVTAARGVAQSALAVLLFSEKVSTGRILGIIFILSGSALYAIGKDRVMKEKPPPAYERLSHDEKETQDGYAKHQA